MDLRELNKFIRWEYFKMEGINSSSQGHSTGRGLDGETSPKRCILCSGNSPGAQAVSANIMEGDDIPIQLPSLRTVISPIGVYQNHASM